MYCLLQLVMMPIIVNKVYSTIILAFGYHEKFSHALSQLEVFSYLETH